MTHATYRSIYVPLDGTPFAEHALPLAAAIARRCNAALKLALVHLPVPALAVALEVPDVKVQLDEEARASELTYLAKTIDRVSQLMDVTATGTILDGEVTRALGDHLEQSGADLVIIATHGRGPVSRFWLGSVADQLMRQLHMPVLILRAGENTPPPVELRHILITLDGSPFAEQALTGAVTLGGPYGAEYSLLMVVEPPRPIVDPSAMVLVPVAVDGEVYSMATATGYLETQAEPLRQEGFRVRTHAICAEGAGVAATIVAQAETLGIDVVAIASHGAGGLRRLVVGSVADKVIRGSTRPTLVVRPPIGAGVD
jgi:nucleotide-binding universal stress UspA family protein